MRIPMEIPADIDTALPSQVGNKKVLYRRSDIRNYLNANTIQRGANPRGAAV